MRLTSLVVSVSVIRDLKDSHSFDLTVSHRRTSVLPKLNQGFTELKTINARYHLMNGFLQRPGGLGFENDFVFSFKVDRQSELPRQCR